MIAFLWGAVMFCMGFVKDWKQLTALRFVLGIMEAGSFPGTARSTVTDSDQATSPAACT